MATAGCASHLVGEEKKEAEEATVWIRGLERIDRARTILRALDLPGHVGDPTGPSAMTFWVTGGTETGVFRGTVETGPITDELGNPASPTNPVDTGIPSTPGHYSTPAVFGLVPPPGISAQIQVAFKPGRLRGRMRGDGAASVAPSLLFIDLKKRIHCCLGAEVGFPSRAEATGATLVLFDRLAGGRAPATLWIPVPES